MVSFNYFLIILFTSLFFGFLLIFFGNKTGLTKLYITYFFFFFLALVNLFLQTIYILNSNSILKYKLFDSISFDNYTISFSFLIDKLTIIMMFIVICITFVVSLFSIWYMKGDPNQLKFLTYLNFFMFFMLLLVSSDSLIIIFIGWEGIGLFSYLLINFWTSRTNANRSGFKAIFVNKFGDISLYAFIGFFYFLFETFTDRNSKPLYSHSLYDENIILDLDIIFIIALLLILSATAKSAQFLMHVWLPDAMEGPTPVSALLHAATMVTAGAYILIKFNWIFYYNENIFLILAIIGLLTNFLSSFVAIFQYDLKKIIAYSTASQMGLIFIGIGVSQPFLSLFHLYNHAFFKALLFILAGIVIHFINDKQDSRLMYKIKENFHFLYSAFLISLLTLLGVPYLSSFYSKEIIINAAFFNMHIFSSLITLFLNISVITTIVYALKIIYLIFFSKLTTNLFIFMIWQPPKKNFRFFTIIAGICYILCFFSMFSGYLAQNQFNSDYTVFLNTEDLFNEKGGTFFAEEYFSFITISVSMLCGTILFESMFVHWLYYELNYTNLSKFANFFSRKFFFDNIYFYIYKFISVFKNFNKEEKNFNENSFIFLIKEKKKKVVRLISYIYFNKLLLFLFIFLLIINIIFIFSYPWIYLLCIATYIISLFFTKK